MIIAEQLTLEIWSPVSSNSDSPAPTWTRLKCNEIELSNSIEFADWQEDPVIPLVCSECRTAGCGACRLAHLVRTDDQLLWLQAYYAEIIGVPSEELDDRSITDSVLMGGSQWDELCAQFDQLPRFDSIRRITNRDLWTLWRQQQPNCVKRGLHETNARHLREKCLASHPLDLEDAMPIVLPMLDNPDRSTEPIEGRFELIDRDRDGIQAFYFDDDDFSEWLAFTSEPPHQPIIANRWILRR